MAAKPTPVEEKIARLASRTHGVVSRSSLLRAGLTRHEIQGRVERGVLRPVHRGVYRVGHGAPSVEARYMAAVLAGGDGAVLAGRAAGYLFGILRGAPPPAEVATRGKREIPGVTTRRTTVRERTVWKGIPVTSVARTLVDLAGVLEQDDLARACHEVVIRHRTAPSQVERILARRPKRRGAAMLKAVMHGDVKVTLSKLERRFLDLLEEHDLPLPETNRRTGTKRVDCRWPANRLTVELDGFRFHNSRHAWEQDRRREREAHARGDDFRRYTYDDVLENQAAMLAELRLLLPTARTP